MDEIYKQEIKSGQYHVSHPTENLTLYTMNLDSEIAIACYASEKHIAGFARNLDERTLQNFFNEFGPDSLMSALRITIVGGDDSAQSQDYINDLLKWLQQIDADRNIINITAFDVGQRPHPNSISFNTYSGLLSDAQTVY